MRPIVCLAIAVATFSTAFPSSADAATIVRRMLENGGSACTGALPTYEGALRKRPQAIANEGTTTAFVTCSLAINELDASAPHLAYLRLLNNNAVPVSVTCTFVNGAQWQGSEFFPMTLELSANGSRNWQWGVVSGTEPFPKRQVNFSCALPPGIAVAFVGQEFRQEIGAP